MMPIEQKQFTASVTYELWGFPKGMAPRQNPEVGIMVSEANFDEMIAPRLTEVRSEYEARVHELERSLRAKSERVVELEDQIEQMNHRAQLAGAAGHR